MNTDNRNKKNLFLFLFICVYLCPICGLNCISSYGATKITFDPSGTMRIDGKPMFVISFTMAPPVDGKTPDGNNAYDELHDAGGNYVRVPPPTRGLETVDGKLPPVHWDEDGIATIKKYLDVAADHHMYGWISLRGIETLKPDDKRKEGQLRKVIGEFKDHPAIGGYKASDEPAWGHVPVETVVRAYRVIHEVDPYHPVLILHAPKFTADVIAPYMAGTDITGEDIFPIGYPMGKHSDMPNKELSVVADETDKIMRAAHGKPVWMTLQIAWSGVSRPGQNTLRYPSFFEERYMTYAAIIHGARGINYFGGQVPKTLNERDAKLGWNWTFWDRVLKSVVQEIGDKSPLNPALLVPNSKIPVKLQAVPPAPADNDSTAAVGKGDIDFCVREVGNDLFLLAAKREGPVSRVSFSGLPLKDQTSELLFESPRKVTVKDGAFTDWFAPHEVHVYRFAKATTP